MNQPTLAYDEAARTGVINFPNGHKLRVRGVEKAQAEAFFAKNAAEFAKRDCILHTTACFEVRSDG